MKLRRIVTILLCIIMLSSICSSGATLEEYNKARIYSAGKRTGYEAVTIKGNVYIPLDALKKYGDCSKLQFDEDQLKVIINPGEMDIFIADAKTTEFIKENAGSCYIPMKSIEKQLYVSLNAIGPLTKLAYTCNGSESFSNADQVDITTVHLTSYASADNLGKVTAENALLAGSIMDNMDESYTLSKGTLAFIKSESRSMYKIETLQGVVGFISKADFAPVDGSETLPDYMYLAKEKANFDGCFNLAWLTPSNSGVTQVCPDETDGFDIISPVWFKQEVKGGGNVISYGDRGFVDLAHERNYQVWACINNDFTATGSTAYTTTVLADETLRNKTIAQYLFYACIYDLDGLNVDYEDLSSAASSNIYTNLGKFMETMKTYTDAMGILLSIDTPVPAVYNEKVFDFKKLGENVDYFCVMTYDQYYAGSTYAGSVSDKEWYSAYVEKLQNYMPAEKIVMGVPFYTRVWTVADSSGKKVSSYAATMNSIRSLIEKYDLDPVWKENLGQFFVSYTDEDGNMRQIWIEDPRSIATRASYALENNLAGTCCWKFGQEEDGILQIFSDIYSGEKTPEDFEKEYR